MVSLLTRAGCRRPRAGRRLRRPSGEDGAAPGAPAILSAPEIERLIHHYVGERRRRRSCASCSAARRPRDLSVPDLLELRIRFERLLAASLGAAAARMIVEDQFTISKERGPASSWPRSSSMQHRSRDEEEVRRGERLLASVVAECRRLYLHRRHRRPARHDQPCRAAAHRPRRGRGRPARVPRPPRRRRPARARGRPSTTPWPGRGWRGQVDGPAPGGASASPPTSPSRASSTRGRRGSARSACCAISPSRWRRSGG